MEGQPWAPGYGPPPNLVVLVFGAICYLEASQRAHLEGGLLNSHWTEPPRWRHFRQAPREEAQVTRGHKWASPPQKKKRPSSGCYKKHSSASGRCNVHPIKRPHFKCVIKFRPMRSVR